MNIEKDNFTIIDPENGGNNVEVRFIIGKTELSFWVEEVMGYHYYTNCSELTSEKGSGKLKKEVAYKELRDYLAEEYGLFPFYEAMEGAELK